MKRFVFAGKKWMIGFQTDFKSFKKKHEKATFQVKMDGIYI